MDKGLTARDLTKMMADPATVAALRKVVILHQELTEPEKDLVRESGYVKDLDGDRWGLTSDGAAVLGEEYTDLCASSVFANLRDYARESFSEAVAQGMLVVGSDGRYHVTRVGRQYDVDLLVRHLSYRQHSDPPWLQYLSRDGVRVGEEKYPPMMSVLGWRRLRDKLIESLSENEKRILGIPVKKQCNKKETELLSLVHEYCQTLEKERPSLLRRGVN